MYRSYCIRVLLLALWICGFSAIGASQAQDATALLNIDCTDDYSPIYIFVNGNHVGTIAKGKPQTLSVTPRDGKIIIYAYAKNLLGDKVESANISIAIKPHATTDVKLRSYNSIVDYGPEKAEPWVYSVNRFSIWVPQHDPTFTLKINSKTDLTELYPPSPFGETLRDSQLPQAEGALSEEYLESWEGDWAFPKGSNLSNKALAAIMDATGGRKYMTLTKTGNTIHGHARRTVGDGGVIDTRTYAERIGNNFIRYKTFETSVFGKKKTTYDTLLIKDKNDCRRLYLYSYDPKTSIYTYGNALIKSKD